MATLKAALFAVGAATSAAGQTVVLEVPPAVPAAVRAAQQLLADPSTQRLTRDTTLTGQVRTPLVIFADVTAVGSLDGPVAVLGGTLRLRPGARARGPIYMVGGELIASKAAVAGDLVEAPSGTAVDLERRGDTLVARVRLPPQPRLVPRGLFGLLVPRANRVDGVVFGAGMQVRLAPNDPDLHLDVRVSVPTARPALEGAVSLRWPIARTRALQLDLVRGSSSPDTFFRAELANTVATLGAASDARNYAHRTAVLLGEQADLEDVRPGPMRWVPAWSLRWERYTSLPARKVPSLFGHADPNPPVDDGSVVAVTAGLRGRGAGHVSRGELAAFVTVVPRAPRGPWARRPRTLLLVDARAGYETLGLRATHRLALEAWGWLAPWPTPRFFWRAGGYPYLPTEPRSPLPRGDNGYAVGAAYAVPLGTAPVLGAIELEALHRAASAWPRGRPARAGAQALGLGLRTRFLGLRVFVDPTPPHRRAVALESPILALP